MMSTISANPDEIAHKIVHKEPFDCLLVRPCKLESDTCTVEEGHGRCSARYRFQAILQGHAVELEVWTDHYLPETVIAGKASGRSMAGTAELFFHYPYSRYDWQGAANASDCVYTGGDCWVDSGSMWGQQVWDDVKGADVIEDRLWPELDEIVRGMVEGKH